jgi:hypothetical protein
MCHRGTPQDAVVRLDSKGPCGQSRQSRASRTLEGPEPEDAPRSLPDGGPPPDRGPHRGGQRRRRHAPALTRGPNGSDVGERRERGDRGAGWGGCDLGHFGSRATTVPIRSSRLSGAPQRPGAPELAEVNRLIDAQQLPSPRERIRFGSAAGVRGPDHGFLNWGAVLSPAGSCGNHADSSLSARRLLQAGPSLRDPHAQGPDHGVHARGLQGLGAQRFHQAGERFRVCPHGIYEGSRSWPGVVTPARPTGVLVHSRESQESLQAAEPDSRGPGEGLVRGHPGGTGGFGRLVLEAVIRNSPVEGRPRAPDSALQVIASPRWPGRGRGMLPPPDVQLTLGSKRS